MKKKLSHQSYGIQRRHCASQRIGHAIDGSPAAEEMCPVSVFGSRYRTDNFFGVARPLWQRLEENGERLPIGNLFSFSASSKCEIFKPLSLM